MVIGGHTHRRTDHEAGLVNLGLAPGGEKRLAEGAYSERQGEKQNGSDETPRPARNLPDGERAQGTSGS
jgi:hypothetical protein